MCKNDTLLCTKCAGTKTVWTTCREFLRLKNAGKVESADTTEWIDAHGASDLALIEINVTVTTCSECANKNVRRRSRTDLYAAVNEVVDKLAGIFTVRNAKGELIMPVWIKKKHNPITKEIETDNETGTETETETESETEDEKSTVDAS